MKKTNFLVFTVFAVLLTFNGCKKGDTGPQGPAGADGNADVHAQVFTVSSWIFSTPYYSADIVDTDITQSIVDYGAVIIYISNGSGGWELFPVTVFHGSYSSYYTAVHYLHGVTIWISDSDSVQPADPGTKTFKIIAISSQVMIAHPDLDWSNYSKVQKTLRLTD